MAMLPQTNEYLTITRSLQQVVTQEAESLTNAWCGTLPVEHHVVEPTISPTAASTTAVDDILQYTNKGLHMGRLYRFPTSVYPLTDNLEGFYKLKVDIVRAQKLLSHLCESSRRPNSAAGIFVAIITKSMKVERLTRKQDPL